MKETSRPSRIAVFGSALAGAESDEYRAAREIGELIGKAGWEILCGGYGGVMEAVCLGCRKAGGTSRGIGLEHFTHPHNRYLAGFVKAKTLGERLDYFIANCDLFLALEGGIGTVTEAMFVWDLMKSGQLPGRRLLLYGKSWEQLLLILKENFLIPADAFDPLILLARPTDLVRYLSRTV
ncbi:MAG: LOG family protein [Candidatus Erginobacter occultus]|nr:LOG family protein [Candidatus Erginobacter occultus]